MIEAQRPLKKAKKRDAILFIHRHKYGVRKDTEFKTTEGTEQDGRELEK